MNRLRLVRSIGGAVILAALYPSISADAQEASGPRLKGAWNNVLTGDDDKKQGSVVTMQLVHLKEDNSIAHLYADWSSGVGAYQEGQPGSYGFTLTDDVLRLASWKKKPLYLLTDFAGVDDDTWKFKLAFHIKFDSGETWSWNFGNQILNTSGERTLKMELPYKPL